MPTGDTTTSIDAAIALARPRLADPAVLPTMSQKEFSILLHKLIRNPSDDAWRRPVASEELKDDEDFYLIEFFETPNGPLMAAHVGDECLNAVIVVVDKGVA